MSQRTLLTSLLLAAFLMGCSEARDSTIIKSGDEAAAAKAQGKKLVRPAQKQPS